MSVINVAATVKFNNLPKIAASARGQIGAVVRKTAFDLEIISKESMEGQKTGIVYHRPGGAQHQSSAPGEAPAVDSGVLAGSIQDMFESELLAYVYTNTQYARYLEFGTAFMEARPFFKPAADQVRPAFLAAVKAVLSRV